MRIAYRRMSGAIGVTQREIGTRGLWFEKRRALVDFLRARGHEVEYHNRMTAQSKSFETWNPTQQSLAGIDLMIFEFGSSNARFYGKDLETTVRMANGFQGQKVFINDDPDLPFIWDKITSSNWVCWYNAKSPRPLGKQPSNIECYDMPFSSMSSAREPLMSGYDTGGLVYIGRPLGRGPIVKYLIANKAPWRVYGKQAEWEDFGIFVHEAPNQPERYEFYSKALGSLVLADKKHKEMGWRTGRAYHAALAGCPSLVEADHALLTEFPKFKSIDDINRAFHRWRDPELRSKDWAQQAFAIQDDLNVAVKNMQMLGL